MVRYMYIKLFNRRTLKKSGISKYVRDGWKLILMKMCDGRTLQNFWHMEKCDGRILQISGMYENLSLFMFKNSVETEMKPEPETETEPYQRLCHVDKENIQ